MTISNPRILIYNLDTKNYIVADSYVLGRMSGSGYLAVDVSNFPGGEIRFVLKSFDNPPLSKYQSIYTYRIRVNPVGSIPKTITVRVGIDPTWHWLQLSGHYDVLQRSWDNDEEVKYHLDLPILNAFQNGLIDNGLSTLPLHFHVHATGEESVRSADYHRQQNQFLPMNSANLYIDGNELLPALVDSIKSAQHHVHVNWFFLSPDEMGQKVLDALIERAIAGIEIRVLFAHTLTSVPGSVGGQGVGFTRVSDAIKHLRAAGAKVGDTNKLVASGLIFEPEYRDRVEATWKYHFAGIENMGAGGGLLTDHSKYIVIDGKIGFIGGMNCGIPYLYNIPFDPTKDAEQEVIDRSTAGQPEAFEKWHDLFVRFQGPASSQLQRLFIERWASVTGEYLDRSDLTYFPVNLIPPDPAATAAIKIITNTPGLEQDITFEHVFRFWKARQKIMIATPYMTDDLLGLLFVNASKKNNIDVTMIVPDEHLDFNIVRQFMRTRYDSWRDAGIKLYEYENHMSHVKIAVIDTRYTIVGSYNFSKGSALHLFETCIVIDDSRFAAEVEQRVFAVDISRATQIIGPVDVDIVFGSTLLEPYL